MSEFSQRTINFLANKLQTGVGNAISGGMIGAIMFGYGGLLNSTDVGGYLRFWCEINVDGIG